METCVLIPQELSLAVTAAGARSSGEQMISVWSSARIKQGELFYPFQGTVRIDKLNIYSYVDNDDVSSQKKNLNPNPLYFVHVVSEEFFFQSVNHHITSFHLL